MSLNSEQHSAQLQLKTGVIIAGFCVFLQLYSPQPLLAVFSEYFHESEARVSLIISAATLAVAIFSPFMGIFADSIGRKRIIVPSLFCLSAATLGSAFAGSLDSLIFCRFIAGLFTPGIIAVTLAYISEESHGGSAASVTALYVTGTVLGGLTGRLVSAFIADHFTWRCSFIALGLMTFTGAVCVWRFLPGSKNFVKQARLENAFHAMIMHLQNRRLLATYLTGFTALLCHVGMFTYSNFYLSESPFFLSTSALGMIFLVYSLGLLVTPLAGKLIDRYGHRSGAVIAIVFICAGVLVTLSQNLFIFISGLAVASTGVFIMQASASSHAGLVALDARSSATGLYVAFYYLGGAAGASLLVIPWKAGHWPAVAGTMLFIQCISLFIVLLHFHHKDRNEGSSRNIILD